jgi:hypothetical protein
LPAFCVSQTNGIIARRPPQRKRARAPAGPGRRPPFFAKAGIVKVREEFGAIAGILEWARAGCWLRANLG